MDSVIFLGFAVAYLVLLGWGITLAARHGWLTPANLPLLVLAALVYDNLIIGLGIFNAVTTWIEQILAPRGITPEQAGIIGALMMVGGILGASILPGLSRAGHSTTAATWIPPS